ncbi:MAG: hypothetical protein ABI629_00455 [bacterium]
MTTSSNWRSAWRAVAALGLTALYAALLPAPAAAVCVGDCNSDGRVSIADVQACINLGAGLTAPACAAADRNNDGTVDPNEVDACVLSFLDAATCPMVFTPIPAATFTPTKVLTATVPPTSTIPPTSTVPPTATNTRPPNTPTNTATSVPTNTPAPTNTPTPTQGITERECKLDSTTATPGIAKSRIELNIAALPVPLRFALTGSIKIGTSPPNAQGDSQASCSVQNIGPVNIPGIGVVCISPASGCAVGRRDCDGGTPLGIQVTSDGSLGTCTGESDCATQCATSCGGADKVLNAGCTGFCNLGSQKTCNLDADCLPNDGACDGPDPVGGNGGKCQCTCVDNSAHGASAAGDFQCNLGSNLVVENSAPCGNGDVKINVGTTCIPVGSQRAGSTIANANFSTNSLPAAPNVNDALGSHLSCSAMDSGQTKGISGVGAVNFFGSALGDLAVGLVATCQ